MVSGWCPCVPLRRRESPPPQQTNNRNISRCGPFTISAATDRAEMVQMFYYENRGKCCKKLLRYNGYPNKVRNQTWFLKEVELWLNLRIKDAIYYVGPLKVTCFYFHDEKCWKVRMEENAI